MGEFETVMQTQDEVEGLHNCLEFSNPSRVYIRLCKHGKCFLLLKYIYIYLYLSVTILDWTFTKTHLSKCFV